jgi:UrcA family protein
MNRFATTMIMFALALGFESAYAAPPAEAPSVVVRFGDLDLSRSEGAKQLYQRLNSAAETVCAPLDGGELVRHMKFRECVRTAINTAVAKVDRPALTAYYEAGHRNATNQFALQ